MNSVGKVLAGVVGGAFVAFAAYMVHTIAFVDITGGESPNLVVFGLVWALSVLASVFAARPAKAWRWMFLSAAIITFCAPLATMMFAGSAIAGAEEGAEAAGAAIGGGAITMFTGFLSIFVGGILLIVGLLIGRDQKIVVVTQRSE